MNKLKYWKYIRENEGELDFCCAEGENLFHDIGELTEFSDEQDFFSLDSDNL